MAKQSINIATANSGSGTTLRDGGDLINDNFIELYTKLGDGTDLDTSLSSTGSKITMVSPTITTGVLDGNISGTSIKDEDNMSSDSANHLATQQSIKAYVDAQILTEDTIAELNDTNITSAADGAMLLYDTGTSKWIDNVMSGDATMTDGGVVTIAATAVENGMLADNAVTQAKVSDDAIGAAELYNEQSLVIYASNPTTVTADVNGTISGVTALVVDNASGTIVVGSVLSGTGISGTVSVVATNGSTAVTLSHPQSLTNNNTMTFTPALKILRTAGD